MKTLYYYLFCWMGLFVTCLAHGQSNRIDGIKYTLDKSGKVVLEKGKNVRGTLVIPSEVTIKGRTYPVSVIGESAFEDCDELQSVILPENLSQIDFWSFKNCTNLRSVTFPSSMKRIGVASFENCEALDKVILNGVEEIGSNAFEGCKNLCIEIHGVRSIDYEAFRGCRRLEYYLPEVEDIPEYMGTSVKGNISNYLWKVSVLEDTGIYINKRAFNDCKEVVLHFPTTLKSIGRNAFSGVLKNSDYYSKNELFQVYLPASLEQIGEEAFMNSGVTSVIFAHTATNRPASLQIGRRAFTDCMMLQEMELPSNVTKIDYMTFSRCQSLQSIKASGVTDVGTMAFSDCANLNTVIFSSSLKEVGMEAFRNCPLLTTLRGLNESTVLKSDAFRGSGINIEQVKETFSYCCYSKVYQALLEWRKKGEFETTAQWRARVTPEVQKQKTNQLLKEAEQKYLSAYSILPVQSRLSTYDADRGTYGVTLLCKGREVSTQYIHVPISEAPSVKSMWKNAVITPTWGIRNDRAQVLSFQVNLNGKRYIASDDTSSSSSENTALLFDMPLPELDFGGENIKTAPVTVSIPVVESDIDTQIPVVKTSSPHTFAVIIGNENYQHVTRVPYALNDARIFGEYCVKTLGLPIQNVRSYRDATFGTLLTALADLKNISDAYDGDIRVIFYYAGHGIPDENGKNAYLLPVDSDGRQLEACLPLSRLYEELGALHARSVLVFMDACFSGSQRGEGMLASTRGVAIRVNPDRPLGNTLVFSAAQGDETAYAYPEKGHGLFTYYLLKKIHDTKGNVTLGELSDYVSTQVKRQSVIVNRKSQTPVTMPSTTFSVNWREMKLI